MLVFVSSAQTKACSNVRISFLPVCLSAVLVIGLPSFACHFRGFFHQSNHVDVLKLRKLTRIELIVVGIQVIYLVEKTELTKL